MCLWMQNTETPAAAAAVCSLEERCAQAQKSTVHTQKGRGGGTRRPVCLRAPCCQHGQLLKYLASNASKEGCTACCTSGLTRGRWRRRFGLEAEVWGAERSSPTDTHRDSSKEHACWPLMNGLMLLCHCGRVCLSSCARCNTRSVFFKVIVA